MTLLHASDAGAMVHGKPIIIKITVFRDKRDLPGFLVEDGSALWRRLRMGYFRGPIGGWNYFRNFRICF